jgi:hypothetical protein
MFPVNNVDVSTFIDISQHSCGALSPTGFIYFGQYGTKTAIAKVNPYTNTVSYINAPANFYGLFGTCCAPNGKIFMLSSGISPHKVLVIDTLNNDNEQFNLNYAFEDAQRSETNENKNNHTYSFFESENYDDSDSKINHKNKLYENSDVTLRDFLFAVFAIKTKNKGKKQLLKILI